MKLFIDPIAFIGWGIFFVVQCSLAIDFVIVEVSLVIGAVVIEQFAVALLESIFAHALVLDSVLEKFL